MERVIFYSANDLSAASYLKQVSEKIMKFDMNSDYDINDILEYYNCTQYIDNKLFLIDWTTDFKNLLKENTSIIRRYIFKKINEINNKNFLQIVKNIDYLFIDDFLELLIKSKIICNIDEYVVGKALKKLYFPISTVCKHKILVDLYPGVIHDKLLDDPLNAEIIFRKYMMKPEKSNTIYLPKNLTNKEINDLIKKYIEMDQANLNYLDLIINNHDSNIQINEVVKWKAKEKSNLLEEQTFKDGVTMMTEIIIKLEDDLQTEVEFENKNSQYMIKFDNSYLCGTLGKPSILNNFIWLFGYVDFNGRISYVSHKYIEKSLLDYIKVSSRKDYPNNVKFEITENITEIILDFYYQFLKRKDIDLEDVIQWFFECYLNETFNIHNFKFSAPSIHTTYREKCRNILPEFEYIFLQYRNFVEYGEINHEMLKLSSRGISFKDIPSLLKRKYIYPTVALENILYLLFSTQAHLGYIETDAKKETNLYDLLNKRIVNYEEFKNYQQRELDRLIENNYIKKDNKGNIYWHNPIRIKILKKLYDSNTMLYPRLTNDEKKETKNLYKENLVEFGNTLLSKSESELLDYYLNDATFQNGPKIRNRYLHGRQNDGDDNLHYSNYLIIIKLIVSIVIKINDDLELSSQIKKHKENVYNEFN